MVSIGSTSKLYEIRSPIDGRVIGTVHPHCTFRDTHTPQRDEFGNFITPIRWEDVDDRETCLECGEYLI